jgi:Rod binding domain-containing protein
MSNDLFLTEPISSPIQFGAIDKADAAASKKIEQVAKGFEGLFVKKLTDQINSGVEQFRAEGDDEEDNQGDQIRNMFSMFMSEHIANNGGIGFWKKIYQQIAETNSKSADIQKVDSKI